MNIAIIEDNQTIVTWYQEFFKEVTFPECDPVFIPDIRTFWKNYKNRYFNLALVDFLLPDGNSIPIVQELKSTFPHCHVVMVTSMTNMDEMSKLINIGIDGFMRKPIKPDELQNLLNNVFDDLTLTYGRVFSRLTDQETVDRTIDQTFNQITDQTIPENRDRFIRENIIYESEIMKKVINKSRRIASSDSTVLIRGDSGTGKELIARMIHNHSNRGESPFVELNIAALPESLMESELFGHKKGAFTGAETDRNGRFAEAEGGTLFIDEIGDIPLRIQAKLLRAIQFKTYQRVGDNRTMQANVRILAATSRNLEQMIKSGEYREDLFYRLSVISVTIPSLKERRGDILPLIDFFMKQKAIMHNAEGIMLSEDAMKILTSHDYPGNVRELENAIEHGIIMARGGVIRFQDLPDHFIDAAGKINLPVSSYTDNPETLPENDYTRAMSDFERNLITKALKKQNGNKSAAARSLGIGERKLRYRIQILGIDEKNLL